MSSNNPPNGHSHLDNKLASALRFREGQLRDALKQIQQLTLGIKSISTLAAMYKTQLILIAGEINILATTDQATEVMNKAHQLLKVQHMEPVNEILRLRGELEKANELTGSQANMISQMEEEVRKLEAQVRELRDLYNQTKKDL